MSVSSIAQSSTILTPAIKQAPVEVAVADNDGDADDHGGPPDVDGPNGRIDIKV